MPRTSANPCVILGALLRQRGGKGSYKKVGSTPCTRTAPEQGNRIDPNLLAECRHTCSLHEQALCSQCEKDGIEYADKWGALFRALPVTGNTPN